MLLGHMAQQTSGLFSNLQFSKSLANAVLAELGVLQHGANSADADLMHRLNQLNPLEFTENKKVLFLFNLEPRE